MKHSSGFTLLEILVSVAIVTLIGLASNSVLNTILSTDSTSSKRFDELQKLQRAMMILERDLQQVVPRPARVQGQENKAVFSGGLNVAESDADGILFVRAGRENPQWILPRSTLQAVGYRLQENELQRLYGNYVDNVVGTEAKIRVLLENVEDLQISYMVVDADGAVEWEETYTGTVLPTLIRIEMATQEFGLLVREFALSRSSNST
ncbi:MAG: type II secretion system minor pseudopilin GspJ [Aestuariibacter sp.]